MAVAGGGAWRLVAVLLIALVAGCDGYAFKKLEPMAGIKPDLARPPPGVTAADHGARLLAEGRPALAEKAFRLSLAEEGTTASVLVGLGSAQRAQGRLGEARRVLERAVALDPDNAAAQNNLGVVLFELKEYDRAEIRFGIAAALQERQGRSPDPDVTQNLGHSRDARERIAAETEEAPQPTHEVRSTGDGRYLLIKAEEGAQ